MKQGGRLNYARRQQYRRLWRAGMAAMTSGAVMLLALGLASEGALSVAGTLLVAALGLGVYARHWLSIAGRSRVGARSEDEVRRPRLHRFRRKGGGCVIRCPGGDEGTST